MGKLELAHAPGPKQIMRTCMNTILLDVVAKGLNNRCIENKSNRNTEKYNDETTAYRFEIIIIIIISGFGIYGAAVVPDSGVGNTWQRLTLVLHEFLSNGLTPSRLHMVISFLTHADHVFLGLPRFLVPGTPNRVMELRLTIEDGMYDLLEVNIEFMFDNRKGV